MSITGFVTCLICASALTLVAATSRGQEALDKKVTISIKDQSLENALDQLAKVTSVTISYGDNKALEEHLSLNAKDEKLGAVLDRLLSNRPFSYVSIDDKIIIQFTPDKSKKEKVTPPPVTGKVVDEKGEPLPGATVKVKGTEITTVTNSEGLFKLQPLPPNSVLIVSYIGYQPQEIAVGNGEALSIVLQLSSSKLDEVVIIPYGTTTQRLNTGSITKVTAAEIAQQPVSNPLAALEGKVPGLVITQTNGVPGSKFNVLLRGQNALSTDQSANSDPLFIIDGIPFAPNNVSINQIGSAVGANGLSPFNSINPNDIESIEVLKDADATAIYGSRGAYGVILITTKKGKAGRTLLTANVYSGISSTTRTMDLLNTGQYLAIRKEAFKNDGVVPDATNAPDLILYDQNKYTDWKKYFIGQNAHLTDVQANLSGGNENTQFLLGGNYHNETTVFPGNNGDSRAVLHLNINHTSSNKKFSLSLTTSYSSDNNNILAGDLTSFIYYPPNYPSLLDENGKLVWSIGGTTISNPMSYLERSYAANTNNLISNLQLNYKLLQNLTLKASFGYNKLRLDETSVSPSTASAPQNNPTGSSQFGGNDYSSWIIEPQLEYKKHFGDGNLNLLLGGTWQETKNTTNYIQGLGYTSDYLLKSISAAGSISSRNDYNLYRYTAIFGRINYNWQDKYIVNLSGRRDGSSRFGSGKQFANFGAAGLAWIFTNEQFLSEKLPFLNFGKLRGSYGITGSDMIGNYQYLDSWTSTPNAYQGTAGLMPARLANTDYSWEVNKKMEAAIDLSFLKDRVLVSAAYYRNRSSNHLISYKLPSQTGFANIIKNFPAVIQNTGIELSLDTKNLDGGAFKWNTNITLTIPENKLISFPGLETSSYSSAYVVGKSLNIVKGLEYLGVDPATGIFKFKDQNGDGNYDSKDLVIIGQRNPGFYGGIQNNLSYKQFNLNFFFEFRKQKGNNYLASVYNTSVNIPGFRANLPVTLLDRWQNPGDITQFQKYTATSGSQAYTAANLMYNYANSLTFTDASFIRLRNVYLSYNLPASFLQRLKIVNAKVYLQGQNLLLFTRYKGNDPETMNYFSLPPLKTISAGLQISL